jgi:hypothetical protein
VICVCARECVCVCVCVLCLFLEDHCHCISIVHEKSEVNHNADFALALSENLKILLSKRM